MTETQIQSQIMEYLKLSGITAWRNNTRTVKLGGRMVHMGLCKGSSDIIGVLPDGRFLAIEVKRPGGKLTPEQSRFLALVNWRGGVGVVANGTDAVDQLIRRIKCAR